MVLRESEIYPTPCLKYISVYIQITPYWLQLKSIYSHMFDFKRWVTDPTNPSAVICAGFFGTRSLVDTFKSCLTFLVLLWVCLICSCYHSSTSTAWLLDTKANKRHEEDSSSWILLPWQYSAGFGVEKLRYLFFLWGGGVAQTFLVSTHLMTSCEVGREAQ